MRAAGYLSLSTIIFLLATVSSAIAQSFTDIKPSPAQVQWQDLEIGVIIFPQITTQRVRLNLLSTTGSAASREFQLYDGGVAPN